MKRYTLIATFLCLTMLSYGQSFDAFVQSAERYMSQNNYKMALLEYTKAIAYKPTFGDVYSWRGDCYFYLKDYKGAIKDYTKALELGGPNGEIYGTRGVARLNTEYYLGACEDFYRAKDNGVDTVDPLIEKFCQ